MKSRDEFTVAAIQASPILLDRDASTVKACRLIEEAAQTGATLAAFSETWLPGYPFFRDAPASPLFRRAAAEYLNTAVDIPGPTTGALCDTARRAGIDVVIGIVERDRRTRGTVYCTLLFISREGQILGRHRKLKPTYTERLVWGEGDAVGLTVHERPYARISGLNCWEHAMVLPGYALMAQGTQVHVSVWPGSTTSWHVPLSQAFAIQGACYVIAVGAVRSASDIPERYRELEPVDHPGLSCIIDPMGNIIAGPVEGETILTATLSRDLILSAKMSRDMGGHYSRPDIFQLHINRSPLTRLVEHGTETVSDDRNRSDVVQGFKSNGQHSDGADLAADTGQSQSGPGR